jgi:FixJ family two-component response regulator
MTKAPRRPDRYAEPIGQDCVCKFRCGGIERFRRREQQDQRLPKRRLVYVVDDDPSMLRGVKRLLREHGYDCMLFSTADAFQKHNDFDDAVCVILDVDLDDTSGIDVRRRLTAAGISLPVIFITGKDSPATRMAALASGCLAYLTKPFSAGSLIGPIERASTGLA